MEALEECGVLYYEGLKPAETVTSAHYAFLLNHLPEIFLKK